MNTDGASDHTLRERIDTARVAQFFLRLYALQLKAPAGAPARYTRVESEFPGMDNIYTLSVKSRSRFEHRRLAVGHLGAQSSSRSLCYKVVFDTPLVVKIPASPIRTFREYLDSLNRQRLIVDRYDADKRIIAPGVAPFFKCTQMLGDVSDRAAVRLEAMGVKWLEAHPEVHPHLKIGESFVFLMDLSAHAFLSDVIFRIHDVTADLPGEIVSHPSVLWDFHGFENRYGRDRARVHFLMNGVWSEYEKQARQVAREAAVRPRTIYEQRKWLLGRLAGLSPDYPGDASPEFATALDGILSRVLEKNHKVVEAYRQTVKAYVRRIAFSRNSGKIRGLVVSLLDLLAWLAQSRLAIRDLKPHNLFIAGDSDRYSNLAADPQKYYLGLIDIETAIGLGAQAPDQPLLGGTPSYATLSQFYPNAILARVYPDLALILHLQDWYAVAVMAYEAVTGRQLFARTRRLLFDIKALSRKPRSDETGPEAAYRSSNYVFWLRAAEEFERNLQARADRLEAVRIEPGAAARQLLLGHAGHQLERASEAWRRILRLGGDLLGQGPGFDPATAGWQQVKGLRRQLEQATRVASHLSEHQERVLGNVKSLEGVLRVSESLRQGIAALEAPRGELSVHALLALMFYTVGNAMETPRPDRGCGSGAWALAGGESLSGPHRDRSPPSPADSIDARVPAGIE